MKLRKTRTRALTAAALAALAAGTAFVVVGAGTGPGSQPLTPALVAQLSQGPKKPVIVLLRDQHPEAPAGGGPRGAATQSDQRALVDQARQTGATHVHQYSVVNGFAATMTAAESDRLAADPRVQAIVPDLPVRRPAPAGAAGGARAAATPGPGACPADPAKPILEPEALQVTHAASSDGATPQAQTLATGKGVKVAYLADGIDVNNPDFVRPDGSKVFSDYQDFSGEGTATPNDDREAFGDASAIAAQGRQTYDLADFVSPANPLPKGCTIQVRGMAPGASLVGLKVIASSGFGSTSAVVQAIDYAVTVDHVDVINESLGANPYPDSGTDPFSLANNAAVAAGVTVVSSAGDAGYGNTIGSPASDPLIISAGASTTYRLMAQTWDGLPGFAGTWHSDNVAAISSSGITESGRVYDLLAPGDLGWALCSTNTAVHLGCTNYTGKPAPIQAFGGTSQASPLIAGAAALVIQAYAATHGGAKPAPALVKRILTSTATDEFDPAQRQGAGLLDALAAVQAAQSIVDGNGAPAPRGAGLLFGASQLDGTGNPSTVKDFTLPVTNVGAAAQTITAHGRALSTTLSDQQGSVLLDTRAPATMASRGGAPDVDVTKTFTVPAGADHLDASIAWPATGSTTLTMVLLDPAGAFTGYTMPQGAAPNFGHVDVHSPAAGTWTALIYGAHTASGFHNQVSYRFTASQYAGFGVVTGGPLHLNPGQSGTLRVSATTPGRPGDLAAAVEVDTAAHQRFAVPLVLRSLVANDGHGTFAGTLTGGNGRAGGPAQQNTFRFDVQPGRRDLGVSVALQGSVSQNTVGYLVSPDGQILSQATNVTAFDANGNPTAYAKSLQSYVRAPRPGRWSYVVVFANSVSGAATQEQFTGRLRFDLVDVRANGVPSGGVLPAGKPAAVTVRVRNTGSAAESYFVDARSPVAADTQLVPTGSAANVPLTPSAVVTYVVPTETTQLTGVVSGSIPVSSDLAPNTGEPEVLGMPGPGNVALATVRSPAVSQGKWLLEGDQVGPFTGSTAGSGNFAVVARTQGFDPAVTSSTGDQWLATVAAQPPAFTPLSVDAGQSGTIAVTITPTAAKGTVVRGVLYVDDTSTTNNAGDELIAIPYTYTVG